MLSSYKEFISKGEVWYDSVILCTFMIGVILAAGRGSRLKNYTYNMNKCLVKVGEKPIILYTLVDLYRIGIRKCIIVIGYMGEQIKAQLGNSFNDMQIQYIEQKERLGLINALECAAKEINEDFFLTLGDEFIIHPHYKEAVECFNKHQCMCLVGTVTVDDKEFIKKTYTFTKDNEKVFDFIEKPTKVENSYMGTGHVICKKEVIEELKNIPVNESKGEKELVGLFNLFVSKHKKIEIFDIGEKYFNINKEEDYKDLLGNLQRDKER